MFLYESHLGGLYFMDEELDYEDLYCEQCGDSDWLIGEANTREEALELLKYDMDIDGSGGWDREYVEKLLDEHFA